MKFDPDCARSILLATEAMPYNSALTVPQLVDQCAGYSEQEVNYHCCKLVEAGFIRAISVHDPRLPVPTVKKVYDLTYAGHQFLASVKSDSIWSQTQTVAKSIGANSMQAIASIASTVVAAAVNRCLGLS